MSNPPVGAGDTDDFDAGNAPGISGITSRPSTRMEANGERPMVFLTQNDAILESDHPRIRIEKGDISTLFEGIEEPNHMLHRNGGIFPWCICGRMDCELAEDPPPPAEPACVMEPEPGPEPAQVVEPEPEPEPEFVPELELDSVPCSLPGCNRQGHASTQRAPYCSSTCHDLDLKAPVARVRGCTDVDWVDGEYAMYRSRVVHPDIDSRRTQRYFRLDPEDGGPWFEAVDGVLHLVMLCHSTPEAGCGRWDIGLISEGAAWLKEPLRRPVCYASSAASPPNSGWQSEYGGVASEGVHENREAMVFEELQGAERFRSSSRARTAAEKRAAAELGR